jgi:hypothetical protein
MKPLMSFAGTEAGTTATIAAEETRAIGVKSLTPS